MELTTTAREMGMDPAAAQRLHAAGKDEPRPIPTRAPDRVNPPADDRLRSRGWRCTGCGHLQVLAAPLPASSAAPCPRCGGISFTTHRG